MGSIAGDNSPLSRWIARCRRLSLGEQPLAGLAVFETGPPSPASLDLVTQVMVLVCALVAPQIWTNTIRHRFLRFLDEAENSLQLKVYLDRSHRIWFAENSKAVECHLRGVVCDRGRYWIGPTEAYILAAPLQPVGVYNHLGREGILPLS